MSRYLEIDFIHVFSGEKESNFIPQPDRTVASLPCIEIFVTKSHTNAKIILTKKFKNYSIMIFNNLSKFFNTSRINLSKIRIKY